MITSIKIKIKNHNTPQKREVTFTITSLFSMNWFAIPSTLFIVYATHILIIHDSPI